VDWQEKRAVALPESRNMGSSLLCAFHRQVFMNVVLAAFKTTLWFKEEFYHGIEPLVMLSFFINTLYAHELDFLIHFF